MKIAITADIHLKAEGQSPERLSALRNILDQMLAEDISCLVIAGDLFDLESRNYAVFDDLCKEKKYEGISFYVISGNHDAGIAQKFFTAKNLKIFEEPELLQIGGFETPFLFVPYDHTKTMGQAIAQLSDGLPDAWVLVGHGDYLAGIKEPNPYEKGVYMPLSRSEIEYYRPARVVLGHIHKGMQLGKVVYPGSACGMDINERGKRKFLLLEDTGYQVTERTIDTDVIFFQETLLALPVTHEWDNIREAAGSCIASWGLGEHEKAKAKIRIKVRGYTSDIRKLSEVLEESFRRFDFLEDRGPDLSDVSLFDDPERTTIVERVKKELDLLGYDQDIKDKIMAEALKFILTP